MTFLAFSPLSLKIIVPPHHADAMRVNKPEFQNRWLVGTGLALVTLVLYLPACQHGFVEYDDQQYVTDNPRVQAGLTWNGLVWAFGFHAGNWHPLAWLSHMLDCQLYGASAGGHHLTNILLHVASTLLLFSVLHRMTNAMWRSAMVAALFAWHPLHVESVAWVAERKDVLCACFWMLTLWLYVRYAARPSVARYFSVLGSFILCLMAKPMAVTLPFVLLLLDYWPLGRIANHRLNVAGAPAPTWNFQLSTCNRLLLEKVPFLVLSAIGCVLTLRAQQIAIVSTAGLTIDQRIPHVLAAYNHYFWAMFFPQNLAVYYPYVINLKPETIVFSGIVMTLVTVLAVVNFRRRPYLIVGWLWFLGTLVPVIGLVQVGDQAWADRYTYLPLIGLFVALVWAAVEFTKNRLVLTTLAAVSGVALLAATSVQLSYWKNTWTLFDHANRVTQENYMAVTVLASQLAKQGKLDEAMALYRTALSYKPTFPEAHFFLGNAFDQAGRPDEAVAEYKKALWFKPTQEQTHIFLGIVLAKQKKYEEAITNYEAALVLNPDSAVAENNLARILHTQGRFDEAMEHYNAALKINPKLALAHNNLGILLLENGRLADGTLQLREALRLNPTNSETQFNLALALNQQQQWAEAAGLFAKTVGLGTTDPKAHYEFATALGHTQQTREAMSQYASALLLQPDYADALDGLAWILSTDARANFRNGPEAVKMAERACQLTEQKDPVKLKTLAAAYAETGRFAEATSTAQTARDLAMQAHRQELVNECSLMLEHFQHGESWRDD
jgi:tetratricopeptide (TPR) repeat protein